MWQLIHTHNNKKMGGKKNGEKRAVICTCRVLVKLKTSKTKSMSISFFFKLHLKSSDTKLPHFVSPSVTPTLTENVHEICCRPGQTTIFQQTTLHTA